MHQASTTAAAAAGQGKSVSQSGSDVTLPTIEFQEQSTGIASRQHQHRQSRILRCLKNTMPSLILVVFVIQLALHLISTFGGQPINDLVPLTIPQARCGRV